MSQHVKVASGRAAGGGGHADLLTGTSVARGENGRFVLIGGRCRACGLKMFPRPPVCSSCLSEEIVSEEMPTSGTLYAFSTVHAGPQRWLKPFVVGYVDLPNGVRVFSHLKGEGLAIGDTVELDVDVVGSNEQDEPLRNFIFRKGSNS